MARPREGRYARTDSARQHNEFRHCARLVAMRPTSRIKAIKLPIIARSWLGSQFTASGCHKYDSVNLHLHGPQATSSALGAQSWSPGPLVGVHC